MISTAERIKMCRVKKGLSQQAISELSAGVLTQSQLSKLENGTKRITDKEIILLGRVMDVPLNSLLEEEE